MAMLDVSAYKRDIMADILSVPEIISALDSDLPGYFKSRSETLVGINLFPFLKIPDAQDTVATYILFKVDADGLNRVNAAYREMRLTFWVMAHKNHMEMEDGDETRIDYIAGLLERLFAGQVKYGFTELELLSNREFLLDDKYLYRELTFQTADIRPEVYG